MKKYFKCLGIALVYAPFAITGIIIIAVGMVCKAVGYALLGDFEHATDENKASETAMSKELEKAQHAIRELTVEMSGTEYEEFMRQLADGRTIRQRLPTGMKVTNKQHLITH